MARDARWVITKALAHIHQRSDMDAAKQTLILEIEKEIEYAFDLAQIPQTPGRKPKPVDGKKD
jgi:hypothetical protein